MTDAAGASPLVRPLTPAIAVPSMVLVALVAIGTVAFYLSGPLGADVSWLITENERILAGQRLYVDFFEPNPPLAAYLYMPAVLLGRLLGVAPELMVVLYTVGFALVATGFAARIIADFALVRRADLLWPVFMLLAGAGWGEHFAQREHFATIAMLPVLAAVAVRARGVKPTALLWIVAGLCGGLVLAIKPHFALGILLPALFAVWRRRSIRALLLPEYVLAGATFLAFVAMILAVFPEYFTKILPVADAVYLGDRRGLVPLLRTPVAVIFEAMLVFAVLAYRKRLGSSETLGVLFWSATGFWLSYLLQGRGFTYHLMPSVTLLGSFVVLSFAEGTNGTERRLDAILALAAAGLMVAVPMIDNVNQWRIGEPLIEAIAPYGPGLTIANLSPDLRAISPLHRVVGAEASAPVTLLMSLGAERIKSELHPTGAWLERIEAVEAFDRTMLREDFGKHPPDIIVTTRDGFDWMAWARRDVGLAVLLDDFEAFAEVPFDDDALVLLRRKGLVPHG